MGATTMLNCNGDTTVVWEPENDSVMEEVIRRKMEEGIQFFLVEPRLEGRAPPLRTRLEDPADARRHRALSIPDADFARMVGVGVAGLVETPAKPARAVRRARTAGEAAAGETVAVQQKRGG